MIDDRDPSDPNPYQSPAWSADDERIGDQRGSEMLSEPICVKGVLSLAEVQQAHPFCTVRVADIVLRLLYFGIFVTGFGAVHSVAPLDLSQANSEGLTWVGE